MELISTDNKLNFKFTNNNESLAEYRIIDTMTICNKLGDYYTLSKVASNKLAKLINFENLKFSEQLYQLSSEYWEKLVAVQLTDPEVIDRLTNNRLLVKDKDIYDIYDDDSNSLNVLEFISRIDINNYLVYLDTHSSDELHVLVISKDNNCGFLLNYYYKEEWISVFSASLSDTLYIYGTAQYSIKYDNESVKPLLDLTNIMNESITTNSMIDSYKDKYSSSLVSLNELTRLVKKLFKIKLVSTTEDYSNKVSEDNGYTTKEVELFNRIVKSVYDDPDLVNRLNTNYLRKAIRFTKVTYKDINEIMVELTMSDKLSITELLGLSYDLVNGNLDYVRLASETLI